MQKMCIRTWNAFQRLKISIIRFNVDSDLEDLLLDSWSVKKVHGGKIFETIDTIA